MTDSERPEEQSPASIPGGEKKPNDGQKEIQPLSLATPDLTPRERKLIADALEQARIKNHPTQVAADALVIERNRALLQAQIDRMFAENLHLRNAATLLPKEMAPSKLAAISRGEVARRLNQSLQYAESYLQWLNDIISDSKIAALFGTAQMSKRAAELYGRLTHVWRLYSIQWRDATNDGRVKIAVEIIFLKIDILRELGVGEEKLSADAFERWYRTKRR